MVLLAGMLLAWPARPARPPRSMRLSATAWPARTTTVRPADRRLPAVGLAALLTVAVSPLVGLMVLGVVHAWPR